MTKSRGIGRGGARPGAGRKPNPPPVVSTEPGMAVEEMAAAGEQPAVIAAALGMSTACLRRQYGQALRHGHARRRREAVGLLFAKARAGDARAILQLMRLTAVAVQPASPRPRRLGKKEQAQEDALTAAEGTDWGSDLEVRRPH